jgi:hypothetical protein
VIIDGVVNFDGEAGYRTPIMRAGSGGTSTFLDPHQYGQDTVEHNEAVLSQTDSEVACLQEAWDWLLLGLQRTPQSVDVVLIGNIGPCVPCQQRIKAFRDMVVSRFDGHARAAVEVVYDQDGASATDTMRYDIPTTYGYPGLPDSALTDGTLIWSYKVT